MAKCDRCDGTGKVTEYVWVFNYYLYAYNPGRRACVPQTVTCPKCKGNKS